MNRAVAPGWSHRTFWPLVALPFVVLTVFGVVRPSPDGVARPTPDGASILPESMIAGALCSMAVFCYLRWLRPWLGTYTAAACVAVLAAAALALYATIAPSCPTGSEARCTPVEVAQTAYAVFLLPVLVTVAVGGPVLLWRSWRSARAALARVEGRARNWRTSSAQDTNDRSSGVVGDGVAPSKRTTPRGTRPKRRR